MKNKETKHIYIPLPQEVADALQRKYKNFGSSLTAELKNYAIREYQQRSSSQSIVVSPEKKLISFQIPISILSLLKEQADGRTMTGFINKILFDYFNTPQPAPAEKFWGGQNDSNEIDSVPDAIDVSDNEPGSVDDSNDSNEIDSVPDTIDIPDNEPGSVDTSNEVGGASSLDTLEQLANTMRTKFSRYG